MRALTEGTWGEIGELYTSVPSGLIEMLAIPDLDPSESSNFTMNFKSNPSINFGWLERTGT